MQKWNWYKLVVGIAIATGALWAGSYFVHYFNRSYETQRLCFPTFITADVVFALGFVVILTIDTTATDGD